jgi:hypothetical protein
MELMITACVDKDEFEELDTINWLDDIVMVSGREFALWDITDKDNVKIIMHGDDCCDDIGERMHAFIEGVEYSNRDVKSYKDGRILFCDDECHPVFNWEDLHEL